MAVTVPVTYIASLAVKISAGFFKWRNKRKQTKLLTDIAIARSSAIANAKRVELAAARIEAGSSVRGEINALVEWQIWQDREDRIRYDAGIVHDPYAEKLPTTRIDLRSGKMVVES